MHSRVLIGLLLALACAAAASLGGLWKQKGVVDVADVDIRHPLSSAAALFRSKWFVIGWIVAAFAWLLHIGALALAPISLAQAVTCGGVVILGLLAERFFGFELSRRQWVGLVILAAGMGALAVTAHGESDHASYGIVAIASFEVICMALASGCALGCRAPRLRQHHGLLLAVAAGIGFGVADVSIKAVTSGTHGLLGVAPWTLFGIICGVGAFYASARSLQIGDAVAVIAASTSAANLLGILGGVVVFGDPLGNDAATVGGRLLAFALVLVAVALMPAPVRAHEATREEAIESARAEDDGCEVVSAWEAA
jgi:drug/metabolite transporter (DMT)-like permease